MSIGLPRAYWAHNTIEIIRQGIEQGLHIGAQVYIAQNGKPKADIAIGAAAPKVDDKPSISMTTDTLAGWLSAGKPITAVAIAQLFEQGKLKLDDAVAKYIPPFAQHSKENITIKHLLTHTAGIRAAPFKFPRDSWDKIIETINQVRPEPRWAPGKKAGYHVHTAWFILGELVHIISGEDISKYARKHIFEPAGMNDFWLGMDEKQYESYKKDKLIETIVDTSHANTIESETKGGFNLPESIQRPWPSANARGPANQLGRFYQMLFNGGEIDGTRILNEDTAKLFTSRQRVGLFDHTFKHTVDLGLGFIIDSKQYSHGAPVPYGYGPYASKGTFGHGGSQSSIGFVDPDNKLVVAIHCNGMPGEKRHQQRMEKILSAVYEDSGIN